MFRSMVLVIIYIIRHGYLGCLMMHNMHDLQCLNVGITPGCYSILPPTTQLWPPMDEVQLACGPSGSRGAKSGRGQADRATTPT